MKWERWHAWAGAGVLLAGGLLLYKQCDRTDAANSADAGFPAEDGLVTKAPDDLLAELYVASPNQTWTKLQRGIGGMVGMLPMTMPGVVVALSDLDPVLANELDGTSPIYGGLAGDPADPAWVLALKLVDGRRARSLLVDGDTSRFGGKDAPGMTLLVPKRVASPGEDVRQVAITTNGWLLVARRATDLPGLGNYVARTLSSRPVPTQTAAAIIDVPHAALSTSLAPKLTALWTNAKTYLKDQDDRMRAARGGRAPDFGDPAAIVAALDGVVTRRIAVVGALDRVRVQIDVAEDSATIRATLTPGKDGAAKEWLDGMTLGDATNVLALPSSSALALSVRDAEATRAAQSKSLEETLASVLRLKDPAPVNAVVESAAKARADVVALAVGVDDPMNLVVRSPVRDAAAARAAVTGAIDLAKTDPFKDLFGISTVTTSKDDVTGLGAVSVATFAHPKPDAGPPRHDSAIAWAIDDKEAVLAWGNEPVVTLRTVARSDKHLSDEASLKPFIESIGSTASTVVIAQPLKLDPRRAALPTAALALAIGKKDSDGFVRVDVPDALLREVSRWQLGL